MKSSGILFGLSSSLLFATGAAFAAPSQVSGIAGVSLAVEPTVSVTVPDQNVEGMVSTSTGTVSATIDFNVVANEETVSLGVSTTNLYRGNDPTGSVTPIMVDTSAVAIEPEHASLVDSTVPMYGGEVAINTPTGTFMGFTTDYKEYQSSQSGEFSQTVRVRPSWSIPTGEVQPTGVYGGYVILHTAVGM